MTAGITVLVVDDEQAGRTTVTDVLQHHGYRVLQANGYGDAMAVFDMNRIALDLLISDVALPGGNGCALAIAMRRQKNLQVLFTSWHVGAETCKYYGLDVTDAHFLPKPFGEKELLRRVRQVLSSADSLPVLSAPRAFTSSG